MACAAAATDFVATSDYTDDPGKGVPSLFDADIQVSDSSSLCMHLLIGCLVRMIELVCKSCAE